ncbi:MarR family transcriptional regulator [Brevibacterium sp. 5221]|uniref:MarR family transcriptional regulator n=1 Tax=Brevibacterium rongguiense TaxID=2695267 RepID=A0A6N9H7P8_9MICO|nr:MarR family transcriptional regulator [Brevibacterium rongguiense]MYM19911.1 MarR family transcriptional regulator [Brevibacterium rongguiense]
MSEPRWLDDGQQRAWRSLLEGFSLLSAELERGLRTRFGIGMGEYEVLVRLSERPDHSMRMAELANGTVMSRSRLTHVVGRMERRGLLERTATAEDGRGVLCSMTEAGWELLKAAAPYHVEDVRENLIDLIDAEDTQALARAMGAVAKHMRGQR